jgi:cell division septation protein DedD
MFLSRAAVFLFTSFSLFAAPLAVHATQQVTIKWDQNTEADIAGYHLLYGTVPGSFNELLDVPAGTSAVVSNLADGGVYYFAVTAYNTAGVESLPSAELVFIAPIATPTPTPTPTATPAPTATPLPTATPSATATPSPTATPVASPTPTATPTASWAGSLMARIARD